MARRFSRSSVDYRGSARRNIKQGDRVVSRFQQSTGRERANEPDFDLMAQTGLQTGSISRNDFDIAVAYYVQRGSEQADARTMALLAIDTAKMNNTSIYNILDDSKDTVSFAPDIYKDMNLLRSPSNQTDSVLSVDNSKSRLSGLIQP